MAYRFNVLFYRLTLLFIFISLAAFSAESPKDLAKRERMLQMYERYKSEAFSDAPDISVEELLRLLKKEKTVLADVRSKKERKVSIIPGALTEKEFKKKLNQYKDEKIIVYCTIGYRSGIFTRKMKKRNLDAYNLIGGILAWAHAGQTFSSPNNDSLSAHVYGEDWNLLPEMYRAVW